MLLPAARSAAARPQPVTAREAMAELVPAGIVLVWITTVLAVDHRVAPWGQLLLGLATWAVLVALLRGETPMVRRQVAVVIVFATLVEYTFSPLLEVYTYRLGGVLGVPSFVPPGHGLVYLAALVIGRSTPVRRHARLLAAATVVAGGAYAAWGLWLSPRPDALGAFWYVCLVGFLAFGRQRLVYVGAFIVVTYLEIVGTRWGVWTWAPLDPTGIVTIGNPPSVAAGGYGWFDLAAIQLAPWLARWTPPWRRDVRTRRSRAGGSDPSRSPARSSSPST